MARRVHFIGICGTAMGTLAAMLQRRGDRVRGSDAHVYPPMSDLLRAEGIALLDGYDAAHIDDAIDVVVVGNAISRGNPELEAVLDRSVRYVSLPEMIRETFLWTADAVVIAGTHGKTTTTALTGWLLTAAGADPSVLIGGVAHNFGEGGGSYRLGRGRAFVLEGDEYDSAYFDKTAKFLKYLPDIAVVNNVEFDHADIYADFDAVRLAFRRFVGLVPRTGLVLLGADNQAAAALQAFAHAPVQTFGLAADATWRAAEVEQHGASTSFVVHGPGGVSGRVTVPLVGVYNVRNALAALAVGHARGYDLDTLRRGLAEFRGVKRRLELVGERRGVAVYDDFAHHPTAVAETIAGLRAAHPGRRLWAIFEPRSASSCRRIFQDDFATAFSGADETVVAPVYRSSLPEAERLSVPQLIDDLHAAGRKARTLPDVAAIVATVAAEALPGDDVLVMSNGGFDGIHRKLLEALG